MTQAILPHADVVILGAGQAGLQAALSLREEGFAGTIQMIGDEAALPYQRPPLSKGFLLGQVGEEALELRPQAMLDKLDIRLATGVAGTGIDRAGPASRALRRQRLRLWPLILATGSRVRLWSGAGADLAGIAYLRTLEDARALGPRLEAARDVVVIGAGFIGLEFAAVAAKRGKRVHVLEAADRVMARAVTPAISAFFRERHEIAGWSSASAPSSSGSPGATDRLRAWSSMAASISPPISSSSASLAAFRTPSSPRRRASPSRTAWWWTR